MKCLCPKKAPAIYCINFKLRVCEHCAAWFRRINPDNVVTIFDEDDD